jgi:hypothetical protein
MHDPHTVDLNGRDFGPISENVAYAHGIVIDYGNTPVVCDEYRGETPASSRLRHGWINRSGPNDWLLGRSATKRVHAYAQSKRRRQHLQPNGGDEPPEVCDTVRARRGSDTRRRHGGQPFSH